MSRNLMQFIKLCLFKAEKRHRLAQVAELIDCCPNTDGVVEGNSIHALQYLVDVGVTLEDTYPFTGEKGECRSEIRIAARAARFTQIANSETAIVAALRNSPLVVNLHCPDEIRRYDGGVANPANCRDDINACTHAVVIVGHGEDYWIIRNTWGEGHGDLGHYFLRKGICGVGHEVWSLTLRSAGRG